MSAPWATLASMGRRKERQLQEYRAHYAAYLEQGRWLLEEQHKRGVGFQQNAVALLGFDGVMLAFMASADFLGPVDLSGGGVAGAAGMVGVVLVATSAFASVLVLIPRAAGGVSIEDATTHWAELHEKGKSDEYDATQHFAHALLNSNPLVVPPATRFARARSQIAADLRRWSGRPPVSAQVLVAARDLASLRGRMVAWSAFFLAAGVIALMVRLLAL